MAAGHGTVTSPWARLVSGTMGTGFESLPTLRLWSGITALLGRLPLVLKQPNSTEVEWSGRKISIIVMINRQYGISWGAGCLPADLDIISREGTEGIFWFLEVLGWMGVSEPEVYMPPVKKFGYSSCDGRRESLITLEWYLPLSIDWDLYSSLLLWCVESHARPIPRRHPSLIMKLGSSNP